MSEEEQQGANSEKATVLKHNALALFPADHLAPWMSIHDKKYAVILAGLKTIGKIGKELDRRVWLDAHPGQKLPDGEEEEFQPERVRGAAGMFGFCLETLASDIHDLAPSVDGIGRRQALGISVAHGTAAVAQEPKKRTFFEKITGRGKDKEK